MSEDNWAYPYIQTALEAGLVELESDSSFKPDLAMRRGEMARAISAMPYPSAPLFVVLS